MPRRSDVTVQRPAPPSLWRNRDFLLLWSGQAISSVGTQVSQLALPLLVLALTGSIAQAGLVGALRTLPYLVLALPAGALIDRWNRKLVMILCDAGRAIALGSLALALALGHLSMPQVYAVSVLEGALFVFFNLAEVACLPRVVSQAQLPAAVARNEATANASYLLGPLLGGALYTVSSVLPFLADAISYAASVISLLFIRGAFQGERPVGARRPLRAEVMDGLRWLWRHPVVRFIAILTGGGWLVESGYILVIIRLATRQHASPAVIGAIFALGGVGGVVGAALAGVAQRHFSFRQIVLGVHWIWALLLPLFAIAPNALALGAVTAAAFGITPIYGAAQYSYRLALIPDALSGRVNSVFRLIVFAGQPLGLALAGALLQSLGPTSAVVALFALLAALAFAATLSPALRGAPLVGGGPSV